MDGRTVGQGHAVPTHRARQGQDGCCLGSRAKWWATLGLGWEHGGTHGYLLPPGPSKHQSAVTCLQFSSKFVVTSSDDGTVKLWDLKTGEFVRNLVALESGGSGGVVWRIRASNTKLVCAVGSRNGTEETKLLVLDFDVDLK